MADYFCSAPNQPENCEDAEKWGGKLKIRENG